MYSWQMSLSSLFEVNSILAVGAAFEYIFECWSYHLSNIFSSHITGGIFDYGSREEKPVFTITL